MSWPIYSERFIGTQGVAGFFTYTVPAGRRGVIKTVTALNYGTASAAFSCSISGITVVYELLPGGTFHYWTGLVLPVYASEFVRMETSASTLALTCSGFLLTAPTMAREARPVAFRPWDEGPPPELEELPSTG